MTTHMTRKEKLLSGLNLQTAVGIEIGALDKPIIPPSTPHVFYVDHANTEVLRSKYQGDPYVNVDELVQVHGVWGDASLAQAAARVAPVDFVIASHVVEHVPDLIAWLRELASVLKPRGEVRLAIPDRRYTLDVLRGETRAADVLASHLAGARRPQAREILDYMTHLVDVDTWKIWDGTQDTASLTRQSSIEGGMAVVRDSADNGNYHDVHCWVFTPLSFAVLMHDLASAAYQPFKCAGYFPTERNTNEFFITLQLCTDAAEAAASWKLLQQTIETHLEAQARELREAHAHEIRALDIKLRQAQVQVEVAQAQVELAQARVEVVQTQVHDAHARDVLRLQEVQAAEGARLALADTVAASEAQIAGLTNTVAQLRASTSWRITAPVRAVGTWLRRFRH